MEKTGDLREKNAEEIRVPTDGTYMNVIRFGRGSRTLVMLPGVSLCGFSGLGDAIAAAYEKIAEAFTVYLIDSGKELPEGSSTETLAEDVYRAMKALNITQADVYGVSLGGMLAETLALRHPETVRKLAVCSSLCRANDMVRRVAEEWIRLAERQEVRELNRSFFRAIYSEEFRSQNRELLESAETLGTQEELRRLKTLTEAVLTFDLYDEICRLSCPLFVIGDETDRVSGPAGARELAERAGGELFLYNGYGHAVYDEAPDIKERLLDFFLKEEAGQQGET